MFSRSSGYAIQALTYLAGQSCGKLVGAREIATTLQIPMPFLCKILRKPGEKKLLRSCKGVRGGYELARPAETIHVSEIMAAGPDDALVCGCVLGLANCDDQQPCALHYRWKSLRTQIEAMLETTTLADLVRDAKRARRKIAATPRHQEIFHLLKSLCVFSRRAGLSLVTPGPEVSEPNQRQSSVVPLLLIIAMIVAFVGVAGYYVAQNRKVLRAAEASNLIAPSLKQDGPVTIRFRTGMVIGSVQDRPHDPNYRLLEKAGLVKVGKDKGRVTPIILTEAGRRLLAEIPGVSQTKDAKDGTDEYVVLVAQRTLAGTPKVTMTGMGRVTAEFTWAWEPNKMGDLFDASGPLVKSFNTWDRGTLIDKYGAKFYHATPTKVIMAFFKADKGWQVAAE